MSLDDDELNDTHIPQDVDKRSLLQHCVFQIPDRKGWGIPEQFDNSSHPGACWQVDPEASVAVLYKGTSQQPKQAKYLPCYAIVEPTKENGLASRTYFRVSSPYVFRLRRIELLYHDNLLGRLGQAEISEINHALLALVGDQDGD